MNVYWGLMKKISFLIISLLIAGVVQGSDRPYVSAQLELLQKHFTTLGEIVNLKRNIQRCNALLQRDLSDFEHKNIKTKLDGYSTNLFSFEAMAQGQKKKD